MKNRILLCLMFILATLTCIFALSACDENEKEHAHNFENRAFDDKMHWMECVCGLTSFAEPHTFDDSGWCVCGQTLSTNGIYYKVSTDGTYAKVLGYSGTSTKVNISSMYNGLPVTSISSNAFANTDIVEVIIPDSVTSIGKSAFSGCTALENIYFNATAMNDLRSNNDVFYNAGKNGNGIKVVIGKNVTKIPAYLFCPNSIHSSYSPKIVSVEFEEGGVCESIGSYAFEYCTSLTSVTIGNSVTSIGDYAFYECYSLTSVTIPDSVTSIGRSVFVLCTSLTSVTIPDSVTSIGSSAFSGCYKLVEVINKSSLNITAGSDDNGYVAYYAIEVHTEDSKIINYNDYLFYSYEGVNYLFGYVGEDTEIVLPENYNGQSYEIHNSAFRRCTSLKSVTIPDSVTSIGKSAFNGCSGLTSVTIPDSVTSIGDFAFEGCTSLTIYCEATSQPSGWADLWNCWSHCPVVWGYNNTVSR